MAGHVFISYASENADEANELVALIEAKGMTAWIAPRDVRPGFDYSEELQRALETCTAFVVLVTAHANTSPYVRAETEMAFSCQKPILPVRIADVAPAPGLAFFLKIRHWTDAYGKKRDAALSRLILELQTLTGKAPSWAPKVGPAAPPPLADTPAPPPSPTPAAPPPLADPVFPAEPVAPAPAAGSRGPLLVGGIVAAAALVVIVVLLIVFRPAPRQQPGPGPGPVVNNFQPTPTPTPPPAQPRAYAGELNDYNVQPRSDLEPNVGSPTPLAIPVGARVTTEEVQRLAADNRVFLIDVLANEHPQTVQGALYMPAGGQPGTFEDINQVQFALQLLQATGGDQSRPLVFFCQGAICWESYNAVLRANAAGYSQIYWYRGGLAAWQEAGLPLAPTPPPFAAGTPGPAAAD
jgi:PQQ-dependent catabolism-associated CXXCW motif protein